MNLEGGKRKMLSERVLKDMDDYVVEALLECKDYEESEVKEWCKKRGIE